MNIVSDLLLLPGNITTCYYNEQWLPVEVTHAPSRRDTKEEVITLIPCPTGIPLARLTILTLGELVSHDTTEQTASLSIFRRSKRTMFIKYRVTESCLGLARHDIVQYSNETYETPLYVCETIILSWSAIFETNINTSRTPRDKAPLEKLRVIQLAKCTVLVDVFSSYT